MGEALAVPHGKQIESIQASNNLTNVRRRYQDHLTAQGNTTSKAYIMTGGIKAWLEKFDNTVDLVEEDPVI